MTYATVQFQNERPLPAIDNSVIMRNTYYNPSHLDGAAGWARGKIASGACSAWEARYLRAQIERIELALSHGRAA